MATERINIVLTAVDNSTRAFTQVQASMSRLQRSFGRLAGFGNPLKLVVAGLAGGLVKLGNEFQKTRRGLDPLGGSFDKLKKDLVGVVGGSDAGQKALAGVVLVIEKLDELIRSPAFQSALSFLGTELSNFATRLGALASIWDTNKSLFENLANVDKVTSMGLFKPGGGALPSGNGPLEVTMSHFNRYPDKDKGFPNNDVIHGYELLQKESSALAKKVNGELVGAFDNFGSALAGVARGASTLFDVLTNQLNKLTDIFADFAFQQILKFVMGGMSGGFGTPGLSGFGGGINANPVVFGGPRAAGGPVQSGKFYTVGEHGPETLMAGGNGTIIPNGGGGGGVTINQQIDARGSTMGPGEFRAILAQNNKRLKDEIGRQMGKTLSGGYGLTPRPIPR